MSSDSPWDQAILALRLLAIDPALGGITLRARAGPVRDGFLGSLAVLDCNLVKLHPAMTDDVLHGGLDLSATLAAGRVVQKQGLLQGPRPILLTMAERTPPGFAARLAAHLDAGGGPLIALDEGAAPDETLPPALQERLAFEVDLTGISRASAIAPKGKTPRPYPVLHTPAQLAQIVTTAAQCGIDSLRAPAFALAAAKAHAVLHGRTALSDADITAACTLTLAHRATQIPEAEPPAPVPETEPDAGEKTQNTDFDIPNEILLDAIRAMLPDDLLDRVAALRARTGKGNGTGAARKGNRRGRPLPSRAGRKGDDARIDLVATLRAAAPWQTIRRHDTGREGLHIRASDIRAKRFEERSDRLLIFAVDASGSAALARLAEAKGAVELLLAQAYARRDHVALISFRGTEAEVLLPPTRSLVQTKRRLASLPGGGGTPLAAGLQSALEQALQAQRRGLTPTICILTDGRANIARDGSANRVLAADDAQHMARTIRANGVDALVIDTGNRPAEALKSLSQTLKAPYLPLPRADANRLSAAVSDALGD